MSGRARSDGTVTYSVERWMQRSGSAAPRQLVTNEADRPLHDPRLAK
jgi:hypothetical protein